MDNKTEIQFVQKARNKPPSNDLVVRERIHKEKQSTFGRLSDFLKVLQVSREQTETAAVPVSEDIFELMAGKNLSTSEAADVRRAFGFVLAEFRNVSEDVQTAIRHNRRSHQLYMIEKWVGNPGISKMDHYEADKHYYFDSGSRKGPYVDLSSRNWANSHEVLRRIRHNLENNDSVTIYDTSEIRPQMTAIEFLDTMKRLGFVADFGWQRSGLVVSADFLGSHRAEQTLQQFRAPVDIKEQRGYMFLPSLLDPDWFQTEGDVSTGYFRLRGDKGHTKWLGSHDMKTKDGIIVSRDLSQLCEKWDKNDLVAQLVYTRSGPDVKVSIDVHSDADALTVAPDAHDLQLPAKT